MKDKSYGKNMEIEQNFRLKGYRNIACVDEVGRGCFAGPLVCAAVIMKPDIRIPYLTDSKKIPKNKHEEFVYKIKENAIAWNIVEVDVETIDKINILQATLLGMKQAIEGLETRPDFALIDGNQKINLSIPQQTINSGDYFVHGISAASLLAKHYRDNLMKRLDKEFGYLYDWSNNAGYPVKNHIELTKKYGITKYHRKSWKTMEKIKNNT